MSFATAGCVSAPGGGVTTRRRATRLPRASASVGRSVSSSSGSRRASVVARAEGEGPGGFFRKLFTGELGAGFGAGGSGAYDGADDTPEMAMLRANVLGETVLRDRRLILAYDASADGWNAAAFHAKCDNMGPAVLIAKTKAGGYFGAFNPIGWASREDYRDAFNAFLVKWPKPGSVREDPYILEKVGGPGAAIFDFGAEGPLFGAEALKIPLGRAPSMGSSYAAIGGAALFGGGKEIKTAKSRLGEYAAPPDGTGTLFAPREKTETTLVELRVYCGEGLDGFYG